jgi:hypothetical protein
VLFGIKRAYVLTLFLFSQAKGELKQVWQEFAKLLGAKALFGYFITLPVITSVKFHGKMMGHPW